MNATEVALPTLSIGVDYLQRENLRGNYVHDWIKDYCKRNKIGYSTIEGKIVLTFKSENQKVWFVRRGNNKFQFFEFW